MQHTGCVLFPSLSSSLVAASHRLPLRFDWAAPANARAAGATAAPFFKQEVFAGGADDAAGELLTDFLRSLSECIAPCAFLFHCSLSQLLTLSAISDEDDDGTGGVGGVGRREKHKLVEQRRREKTKELLVELQQVLQPKPFSLSFSKPRPHFLCRSCCLDPSTRTPQ